MYSIVIRRDGSASFNGGDWSQFMGRYHATVDSGAFVTLTDFIMQNGFLELQSSYEASMTDQPTTITCIRDDRMAKCVRRYGPAGPQNLYGIEVAIDSLAARLIWYPDAQH